MTTNVDDLIREAVSEIEVERAETIEKLRIHVSDLNDEVGNLRRMNAFYMSEGRDEHPIETEYKELVAFDEDGSLTEEQGERLREIAARIAHVASFNQFNLVEEREQLERDGEELRTTSEELREEVEQLRASLEEWKQTNA